MRTITAFLLLMSISAGVYANAGVGISVQGDTQTIYIPINVSPNFRAEPFVAYYKNEDSEDTRETKSEVTVLGVGLFRKNEIVENLDFLYGASIAYTEGESSYKSQYSDTETDADGFAIAPTIGFEYFVIKNVSIGGDISITYLKLDGEETDNGVKGDVTNKTTSSATSLSVRFYFN